MRKKGKISPTRKPTKSSKAPSSKKVRKGRTSQAQKIEILEELEKLETSEAQKIEVERGKQYNHPDLPADNILENFINIGTAWGAILSSYYGKQTGPVPPHVVSHMMVALKTMRAVVPSTFQGDDYHDMENYVKFGARLDPQNKYGDYKTRSYSDTCDMLDDPEYNHPDNSK